MEHAVRGTLVRSGIKYWHLIVKVIPKWIPNLTYPPHIVKCDLRAEADRKFVTCYQQTAYLSACLKIQRF